MDVVLFPAHLLQGQDETGDALLAAELGQQLVGVHALAVPSLHQLGHDSLHFLLLGNGSIQLVVENLDHLNEDSSQLMSLSLDKEWRETFLR